MMPLLYESKHFFIPTWHVVVTIAIITAYLYAHSLREKFYPTLKKEILFESFLISYVMSYLGARSLTILIEEDPSSLYDFFSKLGQFGGLTFFGGLLAALFVQMIYLRKRKEEKKILFGIAGPSVLLGLSIGRIGCFLNGDDYGIPASYWWSVSFPNHKDPIPRVPVQLLESFFVFLLVLFLYFIQKRKNSKPENLGLFSLRGYCVLRFFLEFLRDDNRGFWFGDLLSTSQVICIFLLLMTVNLFKEKARPLLSCLKTKSKDLPSLK